MDDIDLGIISALQEERALSSSVLGKKLNLSESTVRRRISLLTKQNIIRLDYHVNPIKIGLKTIVFLLLDVALDKLDDVAGQLAARTEIRYVSFTTGHYNVVTLALFHNSRELSQFLKLTLAAMSGIKGYEVLLNIDIRKAGGWPGPGGWRGSR